MGKFLSSLSGYRTYIVAVLLGIANTSVALGWLNWEQVSIANGILAPLGLAFLRAGVDKAGKSGPNA